MTNDATAKKLFGKIKKHLTEAKKARSDRQSSISVTVTDFFKNQQPHYMIYVGNYCDENIIAKSVDDIDGVLKIFRTTGQMLEELKHKAGWKNLIVKYGLTDVSISLRQNKSFSLIEKVILPAPICKEFKSLQAYLKKYAGFTMSSMKYYSAAMGGKRGVLWDEYGTPQYIDNKPKRCARFLSEIRAARSSKDTIYCSEGSEKYIDPDEAKYSAYAEIECEGEKRVYVRVVIKTPSGKVKYDEKIY